MFGKLRPLITRLFTPLARGLQWLGITPDMVTIFGTVAVCGIALWLIPAGHLFLGAALLGVFALFDSLDGVLARLTGTAGPWGAFLDSTLDRVADGAVFLAILIYFALRPGLPLQRWGMIAAGAALAFGAVVPYARARAATIGVEACAGWFERPTRLVLALVPLGLVNVGLPVIFLVAALTVIAVGSLITTAQRISQVHRALHQHNRNQRESQ